MMEYSARLPFVYCFAVVCVCLLRLVMCRVRRLLRIMFIITPVSVFSISYCCPTSVSCLLLFLRMILLLCIMSVIVLRPM